MIHEPMRIAVHEGISRSIGMVPIDDRCQYFTRESTRRRSGLMEDWGEPIRRITFEEYVALLFAGTPGVFEVIGL